MRNTHKWLVPTVLLVSLGSHIAAQEFQTEATKDGGVTVKLDGQLVTRYLIKSGAKPILWPLFGPQGQEMTRGYPMRDATTKEKEDHIHHRSVWFTHGDVNGISFWHENKGHGVIRHREFKKVQSGKTAKIITINDWIQPDGTKVCEDERSFTFGADKDVRWIDVEITIRAGKQKVRFGDTKEGSFGIRLAGSMRVELGEGGKILNSEGQTDVAAWGKKARWVDYSGPVGGTTGGLTIMNHPTSFRYPSYWHVRTYGLFAANPFGLHHFLGDDKADGSHTLQPGEEFTLKYRVLLHDGRMSAADLEKAFAAYAGK
jgi:hypothetical protein